MKYVIGMDGGGTKTEVRVADADKNILLSFRAGAINYNGSEKQAIDSNIRDIFQRIIWEGFETGNCAAICIGAAGISNPRVKEQIMEQVTGAGHRCPVSIVGDIETAYAAALENGPGIILIAGTGSICFGKDDIGKTYRMGGYGPIIGDEGSGYALAADILSAVVKAQDGRGKPTILTKLVFDYLKIGSLAELIEYLYRPGRNKREIAELSQLIVPAYDQGDETAILILNKCASDLADLAIPMLAKMNGLSRLAVSGSILIRNKAIFHEFEAKVKAAFPETTIIEPCHDAAYGAVVLALQLGRRQQII